MTVTLVTRARRSMIRSVGDYRDIYDEPRQDKSLGVVGAAHSESSRAMWHQ